MTLDEMIELCQECVDDWVDPACAEDVKMMRNIIAALRAGQALAESVHIALEKEWTVQFAATAQDLEFYVRNWDAALGGKE